MSSNQKRLTLIAWLTATCMLGWALSRGFAGPTRRLDSRAVALGGICWASGISPYVTEHYSSAWRLTFHEPRPSDFIFAYPPTIALLLVPLAWLGVDEALLAIDMLNVVALLAVLWASLYVATEGQGDGSTSSARLAFGLLLASAVGPISGTLLLGQTGLWSLAGMMGLWALPKTPFRAARIACVILATTKPSLALPVLCFLAVTEPALIAIAGAISISLCAPLVWTSDGTAALEHWLSAIKTYAVMPANSPLELASAQHLLFRFAPAMPYSALTGLSALIGFGLGVSARRDQGAATRKYWVPLIAISIALLPLHVYDLILVIPLAAMVPFIARPARFWFPAGVLLAARPAALSLVLSKVGLDFEQAAPCIAAVGASVIAIGVSIHLATGRSLMSDLEAQGVGGAGTARDHQGGQVPLERDVRRASGRYGSR